MSPGKARLWAGIGCVGTMVMTAVFLLSIDGPKAMLPAIPAGAAQEYVAILTFFVAAVGLLLPFDFIGGMLIPAAFEDRPPRFGSWLKHWLRCVTIQVLFYSVTFFIYLQIGREIGAPWLIAMFAVVQFTLIAGQELIWQAMTAQRVGNASEGSTLFVGNSDQRFVGGITGLPGFESILIPAEWKTRLQPSYLKMVVNRRRAAFQSGGRLRGILFAMLWNIASFTAAIMMNGMVISSVAGLMTVFLWFLLFSFVGLLVLPMFNRMSVFALDQSLTGTMDAVELGQAIREVDQLTERDPTRSASAESVFQPIPCPERRAIALTEDGPHHVPAWNVARTALFLSWAFGGPLARAVHCNVGRPELWAMLPTD
jgi:hypothetical protein